MASDVYPSEQTRSPRFGSKQQLISLDSTLFILLVSDYVIKSIIYVHLQYSSQPGASQTLTSLSVFLVSNQSFDNEHFSKRGFHPGTLYKTIIFFLYLGHPCPLSFIQDFCGFVRSDSDKIRCADINLSFDIFFCRGRGHH